MKLCKIVKRYEVLSSIVIMFISLCMSAVSLGSFLENYFSYPNVIFLEGIIIQGVLGLIMLVYAIKMGYGKGLGIKFEGGIKDSYVIWPFLVFTIINVVGSFKEIENIRVNIVNVLLYGVTFFTTGFLEELMLGIICMAFIN
ncbi:MAG: hypothetical protein K5986_06980, partial [Clostridium sp.]|nr:hypothetical protein [Clostridium sp.]